MSCCERNSTSDLIWIFNSSQTQFTNNEKDINMWEFHANFYLFLSLGALRSLWRNAKMQQPSRGWTHIVLFLTQWTLKTRSITFPIWTNERNVSKPSWTSTRSFRFFRFFPTWTERNASTFTKPTPYLILHPKTVFK